jgi:hypothetical protein
MCTAAKIVAAVLDAETGELKSFSMKGDTLAAAGFCAGLPRPVRVAYEAGPTGYGLARYVGVCRGCGAYIQPRSGKGDAYAYCKACHPGAIERHWTDERVLDAMMTWRARYDRFPSSYDRSATHARQRGGQALQRLRSADWPSASTVRALFWDMGSSAGGH